MADGIFIIGIDEVDANIVRETDRIFKSIGDALFEEAKRILEIAQSRVPVKTGALRESGTVHSPVITDSEISVIISFGNEVVKWAIPVHEKVYVRHLTGRSKFLESVILEEMDSIPGRLVKFI